jgi:hypothetical protein
MSWVSDSTKKNHLSYKEADAAFEQNVNSPMTNKYSGKQSGSGGGFSSAGFSSKNRMAGENVADFVSQFQSNENYMNTAPPQSPGNANADSSSSGTTLNDVLGNSYSSNNSSSDKSSSGKVKPTNEANEGSSNEQGTRWKSPSGSSSSNSGGGNGDNQRMAGAALSSNSSSSVNDEDQYKYYYSPYQQASGAEAYAADMAEYNKQAERYKGSIGMESAVAMMHPDARAKARMGNADFSKPNELYESGMKVEARREAKNNQTGRFSPGGPSNGWGRDEYEAFR